MSKDKGYTMKENDSNKLLILIEDISGGEGEALSFWFWSRIAARHIHQPRIV
jgi:hypothetical protein